jgi:hypothetical protein
MKSYSYNASMRKWHLGSKAPYSIILAADQRISPVGYSNHQIWKLDLGNIEPPSIQLSTTFGFRAQNMRIFPQFTESHITVIDPANYVKPPQIEFFAPNYVSLDLEPFLGISVNMEVFIPDSQTIGGKFKIRNSGGKLRKLTFDLCALLNPDHEGQTIQPIKKEISSVLSGKTGGLHPVLFMTGGAEGTSSPYPSLRHSLDLKPGETREFSWAMASLYGQDDSFRHARKTTSINWTALTQKIKMLSRRSIEIKTGDPGWDACLAFSQNIARSLLIPSSGHLPHPSFVQVLHPDNGYSSTGDGTDYGHLWNGQSVFDVWSLASILLPSEPEIIKGFLKNFISIQKEDGYIDGKPGPAGQRQSQLATPLLAQIAEQIYQSDNDQKFLKEVYDAFLSFFFRWFTSDSQTGELHIPVWTSVSQSNFEYNPTFSHWEMSGQGANIQFALNPDLLTYLYLEAQALQKIARIIGKGKSNLMNYQDSLKNWLQNSWDQKSGKFRYLDLESLKCQRGKNISTFKENGTHQIDFSSETPNRFLLQINTQDGLPSRVKVKIKGRDQNKRSITFSVEARDVNWILDRGTFTFPHLMTSISSIQINGLPDSGKIILRLINLQQSDHNSLLPISAGILSCSDVKKIIKKQLSAGKPFLKRFGIPAASNQRNKDIESLKSIWLSQNHMIIKALYDQGFHQEAAEIFGSLMKAVSSTLKRGKSFHRFYNAEIEFASGESNIISGLPSITLFLHLLGLQIITPWKVGVHGFNPFPWPVDVNFKGLHITTFSDHIKIQFPNGKEKIILDSTPCTVETSP